ncbi:hypothetical protein Aab01nite_18570 [Paractinoplanes abujensis]|uniref:Putative membrane protein n=1 Tax=Paractinoplanes abujensis TaxID=882441 RepID=A0A7W7CZ26_9ACTN|nr:class I SAM-dependent methyltransferase [Actinoplanes abujensis]MBB4697257.1 putative membrane protein [Actinoplanes abujensis]GID18267.1 hypothetical protein Aab01nite_18570 [Actinoplanes abujensis]
MTRLRRLARAVVRRLRGLTRRQLAGLLVIVPLALGIAMIGQVAVAVVLLAVLYLLRRIEGSNRATHESARELRATVEQLQRRVIAAVEKERLAAGDRHQELTEAMARTERLTGRGAELLLREQRQEIEALFQLFQAVRPRAPMPSAGPGLQPTDLLGLVYVGRERRPGLTVALGCGPATVWLGYALTGTGGRLVAVDHDAGRVSLVRGLLAEHGLTSVELRHVPRAELVVEGRTVDWYDVDRLDGLNDVDLLLVDSGLAPSAADPLAPALHVLGRRLAPGAAVVVDEEPRVAPRQGGGFGLTVQRRLPGRWAVLSQTAASTPA